MKKSPFKGTTGLSRVFNAYHYSLDGLRSAYKHESAFRQELALGIPLTIIAFILPVSLLAKALMISSIFLVLIVELINSGIEAIVDRVSLEKHDLSKRAKDVGSAAVLISLINCLVIWIFVLLDHFT